MHHRWWLRWCRRPKYQRRSGGTSFATLAFHVDRFDLVMMIDLDALSVMMPMMSSMMMMMRTRRRTRDLLRRDSAVIVMCRLVAVTINRLGLDRRHLFHIFVSRFLILLVDYGYYGFGFVLFFSLGFQLQKKKNGKSQRLERVRVFWSKCLNTTLSNSPSQTQQPDQRNYYHCRAFP